MSGNFGNTATRRRVVVVASKRTPSLGMGRQVPAKELAGHAVRAAIVEAGLRDLSQVDALAAGQVAQDAFTSNFAKHVAEAGGLKDTTPCITLNRQCSSSMDAARLIAEQIYSGCIDIGIAVGAESMADTPYLVPSSVRNSGFNRWLRGATGKPWGKWLSTFGFSKHYGPGLIFGAYGESGLATSMNAIDPRRAGMAKTAQTVANLCGISREDADALAVLSHQRALAGRDRMALEIAPFYVPGVGLITEDEGPRATTAAKVAALRALPDTGGLVTAANASGMGGCGVAVVLASEEAALRMGATILAEVVDFEAAGCDAMTMGLGPVPAVERLFERRNMCAGNIGYWEINEAFAHIWAAIMKSLEIDVNKSNLYGGGISIGHPLGATGARLLGMIAREVYLRRDEPGMEFALGTQCAAGGMGTAVLVRRYRPAA
jgi:acetyl-CoA C-acetyltransferase